MIHNWPCLMAASLPCSLHQIQCKSAQWEVSRTSVSVIMLYSEEPLSLHWGVFFFFSAAAAAACQCQWKHSHASSICFTLKRCQQSRGQDPLPALQGIYCQTHAFIHPPKSLMYLHLKNTLTNGNIPHTVPCIAFWIINSLQYRTAAWLAFV